jgi:uncharacterized membrane protein YkvA (DUF1232 family)
MNLCLTKLRGSKKLLAIHTQWCFRMRTRVVWMSYITSKPEILYLVYPKDAIQDVTPMPKSDDNYLFLHLMSTIKARLKINP